MKVLYADELFMLEVIADGLLLWSAGKLCGSRRKLLRLLCAACFGAVYSLVSLIWKPASCLFMKAASLFSMLLLAYGGEKRIFRVALSFLAMSAVFAGVMEAVIIAAGKTSARALLFALGVSMGLCALPFQFSGKHGGICRIRICRGSAEVELTALRDTGHNLREPISGEPVILAGESVLLPLLSSKQQLLMKRTAGMPAEQRIIHLGQGFRLIPYRSVSGFGLLLGFPVQLCIEGEAAGSYWAGVCANDVCTENGCNALIGSW